MKKSHSIQIFLLALLPLLLFIIFLIIKEHNDKIEATNTYLGEHLIFEDISFSSEGEYLQEIKLYKGEDFDSYHAYIPTLPEAPLRVYFNHCESILFNGIELSSGDLLPTIEPGTPYVVQALTWTHEVFWEDYITFYFCGTLPSVYISTESGTMEQIHQDKEYEESAFYAVYTEEGEFNSAGGCTIEGRGNSSWRKEQKPYTLNLSDSASILGMNSCTDWALLSNYSDDLPQLKNKIVFELAEQLNLSYTPQCEFVHLYLNGQYNGLYLLTQQVDVGDGTVKINNLDIANEIENSSKDNLGIHDFISAEGLLEHGTNFANNPDDISGGYLLEFDARYEKEPSYFTTPHQRVVIRSPKEATQQEVTYIANYIREAEDAIFSNDGRNNSTGNTYLDYLDIDSWSKVYTLQNFFVQWDVEFASFYLYKQSNDQYLYAGPVWDFDLSCGRLYTGTYPKLTTHLLWLKDTQSTWLRRLSTHENFYNYVTQQYLNNFSSSMSNLLESEFSNIVDPLIPAMEMDSVRWNKGNEYLTTINNLYNWLYERHNFLFDYYQNADNYYSVNFNFPWRTVPYYVRKDTALEFLPYDAYGEIPNNLSDYGYENIWGWMDEYGNEVSADDIITKDVDYFPIYEKANQDK